MTNRTLAPADIAPPFGNYGHAVLSDAGQRWLHVSGQVGVDADGVLATGAEGQCRQAFANLLRILAAADMTVADIVRIGVFLTHAGDVAAYRAARDAILQGHRPASTLLVVQALAHPDWLVEIELVAAR